MDQKTLIAGVISLTLSIILIGSILVPVVQDVQTTAGDAVTKSNEFGDYLYSDYSETDLTIEVTYDAINGHSFTVNGTAYTDYVAQTILIADNFVLNVGGSTASNAGSYITVIYTDGVATARSYQSLAADLTVEYSHEDGTLTYTYGTNNAVTIETSTVMAVNGEGNYVYVPTSYVTSVYATEEYIQDGTMGAFTYTNSVTVGDTTLVARIYITAGTVYTFLFDSSTGTNVSDDYTVTFSVEGLQIADGTTDIYTNGQPTIVVTNNDTEETATINSNIVGIVIKEVSGHATSGAAYSLYGVIPVIVIIAIVMMAAGMIYSKRD